jgi:hypothetical protein
LYTPNRERYLLYRKCFVVSIAWRTELIYVVIDYEGSTEGRRDHKNALSGLGFGGMAEWTIAAVLKTVR